MLGSETQQDNLRGLHGSQGIPQVPGSPGKLNTLFTRDPREASLNPPAGQLRGHREKTSLRHFANFLTLHS